MRSLSYLVRPQPHNMVFCAEHCFRNVLRLLSIARNSTRHNYFRAICTWGVQPDKVVKTLVYGQPVLEREASVSGRVGWLVQRSSARCAGAHPKRPYPRVAARLSMPHAALYIRTPNEFKYKPSYIIYELNCYITVCSVYWTWDYSSPCSSEAFGVGKEGKYLFTVIFDTVKIPAKHLWAWKRNWQHATRARNMTRNLCEK